MTSQAANAVLPMPATAPMNTYPHVSSAMNRSTSRASQSRPVKASMPTDGKMLRGSLAARSTGTVPSGSDRSGGRAAWSPRPPGRAPGSSAVTSVISTAEGAASAPSRASRAAPPSRSAHSTGTTVSEPSPAGRWCSATTPIRRRPANTAAPDMPDHCDRPSEVLLTGSGRGGEPWAIRVRCPSSRPFSVSASPLAAWIQPSSSPVVNGAVSRDAHLG